MRTMGQMRLHPQTTPRQGAETSLAQTATLSRSKASGRQLTAPVLKQRTDCCSNWPSHARWMYRRGGLGRHQQPGVVPETLTKTKSWARRARLGLFAVPQK